MGVLDRNGRTPLMVAAMMGNSAALNLMLSRLEAEDPSLAMTSRGV
jgi:ankyrin repeat protein